MSYTKGFLLKEIRIIACVRIPKTMCDGVVSEGVSVFGLPLSVVVNRNAVESSKRKCTLSIISS